MALKIPVVINLGKQQQLQTGDYLASIALGQVSDVIMTSGDLNANEVLFDQNGSIMLHLPS
jgi:hypothetical protein